MMIMHFDPETQVRIQTLSNFSDAYIDAIEANAGKDNYFFEAACSRAFLVVDITDRAMLERSRKDGAEYRSLTPAEVRAIVNEHLASRSGFSGQEYQMNAI